MEPLNKRYKYFACLSPGPAKYELVSHHSLPQRAQLHFFQGTRLYNKPCCLHEFCRAPPPPEARRPCDYVCSAESRVSESISCSARDIFLHNLIPSQDCVRKKKNTTGHKCLNHFSNHAELTSRNTGEHQSTDGIKKRCVCVEYFLLGFVVKR